MYKFIFSVALLYVLFFSCNLFAQKNSRDTVLIKTSAHCEFCEKDILKQLKSMKGVKEVTIERATGLVRVVYNNNRVSADSLRGTLTAMGYDADDKPARNRLMKFKSQNCTEK